MTCIPSGIVKDNIREYRTWHKLTKTPHRVCERWRDDFAAFLLDMGQKPPFGMLKRRDESQPYSRDNCYWA